MHRVDRELVVVATTITAELKRFAYLASVIGLRPLVSVILLLLGGVVMGTSRACL